MPGLPADQTEGVDFPLGVGSSLGSGEGRLPHPTLAAARGGQLRLPSGQRWSGAKTAHQRGAGRCAGSFLTPASTACFSACVKLTVARPLGDPVLQDKNCYPSFVQSSCNWSQVGRWRTAEAPL